VDIELRTARVERIYSDIPRERRPGLIFSVHDFAGRPEMLYSLMEELNKSLCDVNKLVWTARSIRDNLEAFELLKTREKPTIALCMGQAGLISRVLSKKFGGFLSFASLDANSGTAPGQISIAEMKKLYRWDAISPSTKVYGVVGSPIMHSMSPAIHNAGFDAVGFDGIYLPMLVEPGWESFKAFMETFLAFEPLHLRGLSVTLPHKENAMRYLAEKGAEIEPLRSRYPGAMLLGHGNATAGQVLTALDGAWLAHIAAHGTFRADNPMFSSILLDDGPLIVHDFERLGRAPYHLVLAGCDSGVAAPVGADELLGLVSSLMPLGAAGIVASVVPVNDIAVVPVMVALHEALQRGATLPEALLAARRAAGGDPLAEATAHSFLALGA